MDVLGLVKKLSAELKNTSKDVNFSVLGYNISEENKLTDNSFSTVYFADKEVNFYGKPNSKDVADFVDTPFDLLINLASDEKWPIKFATVLSKSSFKVGSSNLNPDIYDLMLDKSKTKSSSEFHNLIIKYLKVINGG